MSDPQYRTDADGVWKIVPETGAEFLEAPSAEWLANHSAVVEPDQDPLVGLLLAAETTRQAVRAAILAGGTLTLARLRDADAAGSAAFAQYLADHQEPTP